MLKKLLFGYLTALSLVFVLSTFSSAQTSPSKFPGIKIENFGQMDERFYRGAQPLPDDYQALKELGITTIIDLRGDPTDYEKSSAEAVGIKYVNIPMSGYKYPRQDQVDEAYSILNNPEMGKVYVHCKAGIHRTGVVGAFYRFKNFGWDYDKAYQEMQNYEFTAGFTHRSFKSYVKDYAKSSEKERTALLEKQKAVSVEK
jgi:tyrosine-protein phosphatase SIW14